jgi:hypothetical protein
LPIVALLALELEEEEVEGEVLEVLVLRKIHP